MHCLIDFKNFARAELNLFEPLTVLLGRNGSGKTNLIEGVELLATLIRGVPFNEITDVDRGGTFEVRGGLRSCIRFGAEKLTLRFNEAVVRFDGKSRSVDYFIEISPRGRSNVQLSAEKLQIGDRILFDATSSGGDLMEVRYDNFSPGRNPTCQVSASHSVLSRYEEIIRNSQATSPQAASVNRNGSGREGLSEKLLYLRPTAEGDARVRTCRVEPTAPARRGQPFGSPVCAE